MRTINQGSNALKIHIFFSGEQRPEGGGRSDPGDEDHAGDRLPSSRCDHPRRLHGAR